jgi:hypothetical protein
MKMFGGQCPRPQEQPECKDWKNKQSFQSATFLRDINFPDGSEVTPGQNLVKEWEIQNSSKILKWKEGTRLIFVRGDRELLDEVEEFPVTLAEPEQKIVLSVPLRVPLKSLPGKRTLVFQLADANRKLEH